ncbi:hypothetical protein SEA_EMOTION_25 [Arthrobacter phage Emotion]|uniref:Uncharacterized protein n=1 Tax=Arthrobacter phage Emotion TaxID=3038361 RepID=A0AA49ET19_9CAUD|nr:hypothetical protein SEA_EMOTION_25 [Arthrobacter phage Emotion]
MKHRSDLRETRDAGKVVYTHHLTPTKEHKMNTNDDVRTARRNLALAEATLRRITTALHAARGAWDYAQSQGVGLAHLAESTEKALDAVAESYRQAQVTINDYKRILAEAEDEVEAAKAAKAQEAPLKFRKVETATGTAYQALSADKSLRYTTYKRDGDWVIRVETTKQICRAEVSGTDLYIGDRIIGQTDAETRRDAYTYLNAYNASAYPLGSYSRNSEAWDAVYDRQRFVEEAVTE